MDSNNDFLWNTFDFCRTVQGFELPFKPSDLLLHSRKPNLVLGYSGAHPSKQVRDGDPVDPVFTVLLLSANHLPPPPPLPS